MDAWTILLLGGAAAIWTAMLSAVVYVVHARAEGARDAGGGIRTPKLLRAPAPKAGVFASSTTPARRQDRHEAP
jgi:ABC-type branched-subunit amino acid transport system permease subunit